MKITLSILFLAACFAAWGDEPRHGGTRSMGRVGDIEWVQAEEVALPDLDFSNGPNTGTAGEAGTNLFSYRKTHPEIANIFAPNPGSAAGKPGAAAGAAGAGGAEGGGDKPAGPDPNKLLWKESSTALVDGKPQLVQFGYDESGNIRGVKFADRDEPVMTNLDGQFPKRLRTAGGGIDQSVGGRRMASINKDTPPCAG